MGKKEIAAAGNTFLPLITPSEILLEEFLNPLGLTANTLAQALTVPAHRIHAIINGQEGITEDMALRLSRYFQNSAEFWMNLQRNYDLAATRREKGLDNSE